MEKREKKNTGYYMNKLIHLIFIHLIIEIISKSSHLALVLIYTQYKGQLLTFLYITTLIFVYFFLNA